MVDGRLSTKRTHPTFTCVDHIRKDVYPNLYPKDEQLGKFTAWKEFDDFYRRRSRATFICVDKSVKIILVSYTSTRFKTSAGRV